MSKTPLNGLSITTDFKTTMIYKIILDRCLKLICLITILFTLSCKISFPQISNEEAQGVKDICSNIKPPDSFIKTKEVDTIKSHAATRSIQYSSPDSPEEVETYFVNLLKQSAWNYQKDGLETLRFKKGKYSISIEVPRLHFTSEKVYFVECSIGLR